MGDKLISGQFGAPEKDEKSSFPDGTFTPGARSVFQGRNFGTYTKSGNKSKEIQGVIEQKRKDIKSYTETKTQQINVTSAFNGAAQLCTAMVNNGLLKLEDYWEKHEEIYKEYFAGLVYSQNVGYEIFGEIKQKIQPTKSNVAGVNDNEKKEAKATEDTTLDLV